jgi:hypothetical protein
MFISGMNYTTTLVVREEFNRIDKIHRIGKKGFYRDGGIWG